MPVNKAYDTFACMLLKIAEGALILCHVLLVIPCPSLERPVFLKCMHTFNSTMYIATEINTCLYIRIRLKCSSVIQV